jgi:transposase
VERLDWLAQNPRYTQRFAQHVGTLCRDMSNKAVAQLLHLHEHTVKDLDRRYMQSLAGQDAAACPASDRRGGPGNSDNVISGAT